MRFAPARRRALLALVALAVPAVAVGSAATAAPAPTAVPAAAGCSGRGVVRVMPRGRSTSLSTASSHVVPRSRATSSPSRPKPRLE